MSHLFFAYDKSLIEGVDHPAISIVSDAYVREEIRLNSSGFGVGKIDLFIFNLCDNTEPIPAAVVALLS